MQLQNQIYVMRHGQSENNVLGVESCLPETEGKFDLIYSSLFRRAVESAELIDLSRLVTLPDS